MKCCGLVATPAWIYYLRDPPRSAISARRQPRCPTVWVCFPHLRSTNHLTEKHMTKQVILRNNGKTPELFIGDGEDGVTIPLTYSQVWRLVVVGVGMLDFPWAKAPLEYPRDPT